MKTERLIAAGTISYPRHRRLAKMKIWRKIDLWINGWLTPAGRVILGVLVAALGVAVVLSWVA